VEKIDDTINIMVSTHSKKSASSPENYGAVSILLPKSMSEELKKFLEDKVNTHRHIICKAHS
jgi:hypothetical protein